ncbi:hypothetical protein [Paraburkholderia diazotrophica]|uniref:hypothetical protein n=1 Tax=Paraburkholderia diazotrophica TaxID=667676 RepID=UPI003179E719
MKAVALIVRFGNSDMNRIVTNIGWLCLERASQIVITVLVSGIFARYFGPNLFGKWQYANTLLAVIIPVTWVCGAEILVPTIVKRSLGDLGSVLGSAFVLRMSVSFLAVLVTWGCIYAGLTDPIVGSMLAGLAVTMLFREPIVGVVNAWLQSITFSRPQLLTSTLTAMGKAVAVYAFARTCVAASWFGWLWALESAIVAFAMVIYFRGRHGGVLGWHVDKRLLVQFAKSGLVFWLGLICMYFFLKIDRLMLAREVSFAALGKYSAALQLNESWIAVTLMLAQTVAPTFVYSVQKYTELRRNLVLLLVLTAALMTVGATALDLLARIIITKIFGPAYVESVRIFRLAVWLALPAGIEAIGNLVLLKFQAKYVVLTKWILALAVAFIMNRWAIPRYGVDGALIGLASGYLSALLVDGGYIVARLRLERDQIEVSKVVGA